MLLSYVKQRVLPARESTALYTGHECAELLHKMEIRERGRYTCATAHTIISVFVLAAPPLAYNVHSIYFSIFFDIYEKNGICLLSSFQKHELFEKTGAM